jgi:protein-S-isoprenylcysteine O-methyltransferase Ste14
MKLKVLIGNGRKIGLLVFPFIIIGVGLNIWKPELFSVGGPSNILRTISIVVLVPGIINWMWSVYLIVTKIPKKELITIGPYALVKHPLYNGVALLVLPWVGFLCNSWLGVVIGSVIFIGSRLYAPEEEKMLSQIFPEKWAEYEKKVLIKCL